MISKFSTSNLMSLLNNIILIIFNNNNCIYKYINLFNLIIVLIINLTPI